MENSINSKPSRMGRPVGTRNTEPSDLVARLREHTKQRQQDLAATLKIGISTLRRYESESIIPTTGEIRDRIFAYAKKQGVKP
jgi:DNA-binding transcriptional regulator YiaG